MANKITWANKVALQEKPDVVAENKVTAADMNQIKTAVNETIDTMPSNLVNGQAEGSIRSIGAYDTTGAPLGEHAQAFGNNTKASGYASHAEGGGTTAQGNNQHVQGKYNISDTTSAHIVGNGAFQNNSNAHTLDWQGNAWFAGDVYTGSTSGKNKDDGSVKLPVVYSGTTAPTNDIGKNGDLYVLLDS